MTDNFYLSAGSAVLSNLYWENLGWTQTPPANRFEFPSGVKLNVPRPLEVSEKFKLFFQSAFDPKVQVPNVFPHGTLPKAVVVEKLKRRFGQEDRKNFLKTFGIVSDLILPSNIVFNNGKVVRLQHEYKPGIPNEPFLELDIFDDISYESRTPDEWMDLGVQDDERKAVPGLAFLPRKDLENEELTFDWQDVAVLKCNASNNTYLVRRLTDCPVEGNQPITLQRMDTAAPYDDIWIPRIYVTFLAEDPVKFAKRVAAAIRNRHKVEESIRFCYYIDSMPLDGLPKLDRSFISKIISVATLSLPELKMLDWVKTKIRSYSHEIRLTYQKTINYNIYKEVTGQDPCLFDEIPNVSTKLLIPRVGYRIPVNYSFKGKLKSFFRRTFWNRVEVVGALQGVQEQIVNLTSRSLYNIPLPNIVPVDEFVLFQRNTLNGIYDFVHTTWLSDIVAIIRSKLKDCGEGNYHVQETNWYAYEHSKLKKLTSLVSFMMQDAIRSLITESLGKYTRLVEEACCNVMHLPENFVWEESFDSSSKRPLKDPVFQVEAVLKGVHLEFANDLQQYHDFVINLFNDGLKSTTEIPHPEKLVLDKMRAGEQLILESVGEREPQVVVWRNAVVTGMDKALIAINAYARSYDQPLSYFAVDQISYVKSFEQKKGKYEELKQLIEFHMKEKKVLSETIPDTIDIGPFRIVMRSIKLAAVKKHESLSGALLVYFAEKLRTCMEDINQEFITLQGRIKQPSGNIEDLLDQEKWFETVPSKISKLSISINQLCQDYKLLAGFYCTLSDDEFSMYWDTVGLPYNTTLVLEYRIDHLDEDKELLRTLLVQDEAQLVEHIAELMALVDGFEKYSDATKAPTFAVDVRKARKDIQHCQKLAALYNRRENLFQIPQSSYDQIETVSQNLLPYEQLWLSIAEFYKWRDRDMSDQEINVDEEQLRAIIDDSYAKLHQCLKLFKHDREIRQSIKSVRREMDDYRHTRFGIEIPEYRDKQGSD